MNATRLHKADLPFDPQTMDIVCRRDGQPRPSGDYTLHFNIDQAIVQHSPDGFNWAYSGSGPADFALNILHLFLPLTGTEECDSCCGTGRIDDDEEPNRKCLDCTGTGMVPTRGQKLYHGRCSHEAWQLHQHFKRQFIATLPEEGGTIHGAEIRSWIAAHLEAKRAAEGIGAA